MKSIHLMLISLLLVTQSHAFGQNERNLLFGLGIGAIVATAVHSKNTHVTRIESTHPVYVQTHHEDVYYEDIDYEELVYENRRHERELRRENIRHEKQHQRERKRHHRMCHDEYASYNSRWY